MTLTPFSGAIGPELWITVMPAAVLAIWKSYDADNSLRSWSHLKRMAIWIALSPGFYLLSYFTVLGVLRGYGATIAWISGHRLEVHVVITGVYLSLYLFAWAVFRKESRKTDLPTIFEMQRRHERMGKELSDVSKRNEEVVEKLSDLTEHAERNRKKMEQMERKRREKEEEIHRRIDEAEEDYESALNRVMSELRDTLDTARSGYRSLKDEVEKMEKTVKSLKGEKADKKGKSWQVELADRVRAFGYETEVNLGGGADLVVKDPASGTELAVVSAKDYDLKTRRGLTGDIEAEVQRAKEDGVPLVVTVKNNLNGQEIYHFCEPGDLDEFTCSAPNRLTGEEATEEQKAETQAGREAFRKLLIDRTP